MRDIVAGEFPCFKYYEKTCAKQCADNMRDDSNHNKDDNNQDNKTFESGWFISIGRAENGKKDNNKNDHKNNDKDKDIEGGYVICSCGEIKNGKIETLKQSYVLQVNPNFLNNKEDKNNKEEDTDINIQCKFAWDKGQVVRKDGQDEQRTMIPGSD